MVSDDDTDSEPAVQEVMLDFEAAVWKAMNSVFPDVTLKGCGFHWNQALWRKVHIILNLIIHVHLHIW